MYRPQRLGRRQAKLTGACHPLQSLLVMDWRRGEGQTNHRRVEAYVEGHMYIDLEALTPDSLLWITVETSPDTQRWGDLQREHLFAAPGYYPVPLSNLGAFVRLTYRVQGAARFAVEWLGKSFSVEGSES